MSRIPFSIEAWLKDKSQKIVTRGGQKAHYVGEDSAGWQVFEVGQRFLRYHHSHLFNGPDEGPNDLFILPSAPKLTPFEEAVKGLCWRIGMGEVIKEDEQIIKVAAELMELAKEEKSVGIVKDEPTAFEMTVAGLCWRVGMREIKGFDQIREWAGKLMKLAKEDLLKDPSLIHELRDKIEPLKMKAMEQGRMMSEKNIPKWEHCECNGVGSQRYTIVSEPFMNPRDEYILDCIGMKRIFLSQLEKLPIIGEAMCGTDATVMSDKSR